jgi:hypothetical protein
MLFKLLTAVLTFLLAAETVYILMHRPPTGRFRPVEEFGYGVVAFDTATGQLCKTLRTKSVAEIEQSEVEAAKKRAPCHPSGDPVLDELKGCGDNGEGLAEKSKADSMLEFVIRLPVCAAIR